ncbi:MAG TPA: heavy metal-associated domain-containing protein [Candidatus Bathyarchaeia archaeon]|nr:heavy metal-associated domain-containing protein [Candidatus Bathyarchaeia archaeon]
MTTNRSEFDRNMLDSRLEDSALASIRHHPEERSASEGGQTGARHFHEEEGPLCLLVRLKLRLVGQSCSMCATPIKTCLEKVRGVESVTVNTVLDLVFVDYDPHLTDVEEIKETIRKIGYSAVPVR